MITAFASTETAVEAMRLGACDYLSKPFDIDLLKMKVREKIENRQLRQENVLLKRTLGLSHQFSNIIGRSEAMLDVFKMIETVARTNSTILLTGESGTGKGLVAQAIHFHSLRRDKPMVSLNCGAMPENLLESELFGHMRGAFTGADANKKGLLEVAEKGTIFLDEIGEMSAVMQVKLLRVLQERRFRRVGGLEELHGRHPRHRRDQPGSARRRSPRAGSAKICSTGSTSFRSRCRRSASAARTSRCSPSTSSPSTPSRWRRTITGDLARGDGAARCSTTGRATSASSRTCIERAVALEATPTILPESLPAAIRGEAPQGRGRAGRGAARGGLRSRGARQGDRAGYIAEALQARRRRPGEGGRAARA